MREELKVTRIDAVPGAAIEKTNWPRKGYTTKVTYTLENGKQYPSSEHAEKLKDLKAKIAKLPKEVNNESAVVEDGRIIMIKSSYMIGGSGLQPLSI